MTSSPRKRQPTEKSCADARAHGAQHLERQAHARLGGAAVAVGRARSGARGTRPSCRRARSAARRRRSRPRARARPRRRTGRAARAAARRRAGGRGRSPPRGSRTRGRGARAASSRREQRVVGQLEQRLAAPRASSPAARPAKPGTAASARAVAVGEPQEAPHEGLPSRGRRLIARKSITWIEAAASAPPSCRAHDLDQPAQPGHEAVVPDAQQRPAGHVADAGRLDHDARRAARRRSGAYQSSTSSVTKPSSVRARAPWRAPTCACGARSGRRAAG